MSNRLLYFILLGIVFGALFGGQFPEAAAYVTFLSTAFMNGLKMIVVPLVITSLIVGVANLGDLRKLGGTGKRTIIYYMATTGLSVIVGLLLVNIIRPGEGLSRNNEDLPQAIYRIDQNTLILENERLQSPAYDDRYQVILKDQNIVGIIDPSKALQTDRVTVKRWAHPQTEASANPAASGTGIIIDLAMADIVRGKDRPIFNVLIDVIVGMIPTNIFKAMVETDILPLIVFSLLFGGVLISMGEAGQPVLNVIQSINTAVMKIVHIVIVFTPIGVFGLVAGRMGEARVASPQPPKNNQAHLVCDP